MIKDIYFKLSGEKTLRKCHLRCDHMKYQKAQDSQDGKKMWKPVKLQN